MSFFFRKSNLHIMLDNEEITHPAWLLPAS